MHVVGALALLFWVMIMMGVLQCPFQEAYLLLRYVDTNEFTQTIEKRAPPRCQRWLVTSRLQQLDRYDC